MKKIISLISAISIILTMFLFSSVNVSAASSTLKFSSNSVEVGNQVTVTVVLQNNTEMIDAQCKITYNESVLKFESGSASGGAGVLTFVSDKSASKYTISLTFTAFAVGQSQIQVKDCVYTYLGGNGAVEESFSGQTASITVKDKALSNNANLKSLSINTGSLSPKFSASRTSYTTKVANNITKVNVTAKVADSGAKVVSVEGNNDLKVGENNVVVTVQAADGTQKKYTIVVTRLNEGELTDEQQQEIEQNEIKEKLETTIDETTYSVVTDISSVTLFKGFSASTTEYNGLEVPVAKDDNGVYTVYYLKTADSDLLVPYTYNSDLKTFERLKYLSLGDNLYIFEKIPDEYKAYNNLYASNLNISDFSVECFSNNDEKLSDFHYVYCYSNGQYSIYRYDSLEGTMQRYPEFMKATDVDEKTENKDNLLTRFASLSLNGKVIIICLLVAILGAVALIVFLVIFLVKKFAKKEENIFFESYEDDFEEISEENDEMTETE